METRTDFAQSCDLSWKSDPITLNVPSTHYYKHSKQLSPFYIKKYGNSSQSLSCNSWQPWWLRAVLPNQQLSFSPNPQRIQLIYCSMWNYLYQGLVPEHVGTFWVLSWEKPTCFFEYTHYLRHAFCFFGCSLSLKEEENRQNAHWKAVFGKLWSTNCSSIISERSQNFRIVLFLHSSKELHFATWELWPIYKWHPIL